MTGELGAPNRVRSMHPQKFGMWLFLVSVVMINPNLSDIDFIISIKDPLKAGEIEAIGKLHAEIERETIQPNLNGIYILESQIGQSADKIDRLTYYHEGKLYTVSNQRSYYEINPITWAELKLHGQSFYGQASKSWNISIDWKQVDQYLFDNINSYWKKWLVESENYFHPYFYQTLFRASENAWCVAGVARQLYTLKEQKIASKRYACEYLIERIPEKFHKILMDTINFRLGKTVRYGWLQKKETLLFLQYGIQQFNLIYKEKYKDQ